MQKIIKKLTARAGYNPEDIPNPSASCMSSLLDAAAADPRMPFCAPALARYFAELEARAFQDEFDGEQVEDRSLPITDVMKKVRASSSPSSPAHPVLTISFCT